MKNLAAILHNRKALFGGLILLALVLAAIFAPLLTDYLPSKRVARPHEMPSLDHLFGSTRMGLDVFSQFFYGARTSLAVGIGAGLLITGIGTTIGLIGGYFGGKIDETLNFATNVALVVPNLPLLLVLAAFIGQASPVVIAVIIGATSWAWGARVTRAQTMTIRQKDFVQGVELMAEQRWRILVAEILPNLISIVGINFIGSVTYAVITEATLEFLGLGSPQIVSWGNMLYNAQSASALSVGAWWEVLAPCVGLALTGIGLALLNFAVDEISNPQLRIGRSRFRWAMLGAAGKQPG